MNTSFSNVVGVHKALNEKEKMLALISAEMVEIETKRETHGTKVV